MTYTKAFPKKTEKSIYPQWEDISLTSEEEALEEQKCREGNNKIMAECLLDAKKLLEVQGKAYESSVATIAAALFEKRASHEVFWKESKARNKHQTKQ